MNHGLRFPILAACILLAWLALPMPAFAEDLRKQLRDLAESHGVAITGLDRVADEVARPATGDARRRFERLLRDYTFILMHDAAGALKEVRISSRKGAAPKPPDRHAIRTTRQGPHHVVQAELVGSGSARRRTSLIVDTGATTIVLPASMIEPLGFRPDDLRDGWSQTANGRIAIKRGTLTSLWIGNVVAHDVAVAFVVDPRLPETRLLGMSFLGRFRVTLDEIDDQLILTTTR